MYEIKIYELRDAKSRIRTFDIWACFSLKLPRPKGKLSEASLPMEVSRKIADAGMRVTRVEFDRKRGLLNVFVLDQEDEHVDLSELPNEVIEELRVSIGAVSSEISKVSVTERDERLMPWRMRKAGPKGLAFPKHWVEQEKIDAALQETKGNSSIPAKISAQPDGRSRQKLDASVQKTIYR